MADFGLHLQRLGDELLLTVEDEEGKTVLAYGIPDGVDALVDAIRDEAYGE